MYLWNYEADLIWKSSYSRDDIFLLYYLIIQNTHGKELLIFFNQLCNVNDYIWQIISFEYYSSKKVTLIISDVPFEIPKRVHIEKPNLSKKNIVQCFGTLKEKVVSFFFFLSRLPVEDRWKFYSESDVG